MYQATQSFTASNGKHYSFRAEITQGEWATLTSSERNKFQRKSVPISIPGRDSRSDSSYSDYSSPFGSDYGSSNNTDPNPSTDFGGFGGGDFGGGGSSGDW